MARHMLVVLSNAADGRDEEFNRWYDETHLADVLGVDGFVAAQRFALSPMMEGAEGPRQRYLALYEIETDDLPGTLKALREAGDMEISDALADPVALVASPIGERMSVEARR